MGTACSAAAPEKGQCGACSTHGDTVHRDCTEQALTLKLPLEKPKGSKMPPAQPRTLTSAHHGMLLIIRLPWP